MDIRHSVSFASLDFDGNPLVVPSCQQVDGFAAADLSGRIYAIGGIGESGVLASVERYDPANPGLGRQFVAPMPAAIGDIDDAAVLGPDGRIWVLGGAHAGGAAINTVEIYDPLLESWSYGPSLLHARDAAGAALGLSGGIYDIYAVGGHNAGLQPLTSVESLYVGEAPPIPEPITMLGFCFGIATVGGYLKHRRR